MTQAVAFLGSDARLRRLCVKTLTKKLEVCGINFEFCDFLLPLKRIQAFAYNEVSRAHPGRPESLSFAENEYFLRDLEKHFGAFLERQFLINFNRLVASSRLNQGFLITTDATPQHFNVLKKMNFYIVEVQSDISTGLETDFHLVHNTGLPNQITKLFDELLQGSKHDRSHVS